MRKLLLAVALVPIAAHADVKPTLSVGTYLNSCEIALQRPGEEAPDAAPCSFYLGGVGDAFTSHLLQPFACAPPHVRNIDVIRAFVAWARANPEYHGEHVFRGVVAALKEAYPC